MSLERREEEVNSKEVRRGRRMRGREEVGWEWGGGGGDGKKKKGEDKKRRRSAFMRYDCFIIFTLKYST